MKRFWLSSSLVLALLAAAAVILIPPEAVGHAPAQHEVVDMATTLSPEPEAAHPGEAERQDAASCLRCIALVTTCVDPDTDLGKPCSVEGSDCRCGFCGTDFNCYPPRLFPSR